MTAATPAWLDKHFFAGELRAVAGILRQYDPSSEFAPGLEKRAAQLDREGEEMLREEMQK